MSAVSRMFVCVAVMAAVGLQAADEDIRIIYDGRTDNRADMPVTGSPVFWDRFKYAFDDSARNVFADQFHPLSTMNWTLELADRDARDVRDKSTSVAINALTKSVTYGFREAAASLEVISTLKESQWLLGNFLVGTVDETREESVAPLDPSFGLVERSWWQRLSKSKRLHFGLRPLRTDPYAFMSFAIRDGDTPLVLGHVRYYFDNFSDHKFELAFSVPVTQGVSFDFGTSYEFGRHDAQKKLVVKFQKEYRSGGILHVGLEVQQHPTLFAGVSLPL